jgi:uncharacterized protein
MGKSNQKNWSKNKVILIFSLIIILITFFLFRKDKTLNQVKININNQNYFLEVASTPKQREIGLSNRQSICANCGMLFIFPREDDHSFWMKDTYIPLDVIWLDKKHKVVKIATLLETNSQKAYIAKAKYVIELNANEVFKHDLKVGDTVQLPDFNE